MGHFPGLSRNAIHYALDPIFGVLAIRGTLSAQMVSAAPRTGARRIVLATPDPDPLSIEDGVVINAIIVRKIIVVSHCPVPDTNTRIALAERRPKRINAVQTFWMRRDS